MRFRLSASSVDAGRRDPDLAGHAQEQLLFELLLEQQDLPADRRLREVQLMPGGRERPGVALARPLVGIANTWTEIGPCNFHLRRLAERVKAGMRAAGGTPMEFNTIAVSDGITMGAEGMRASLVSREVVADSIELVTFGTTWTPSSCSGCDKTIPGTVMALARLNIPGLVFYGGSIAPGHLDGRDSRCRTCSRPSARMPPVASAARS
jgi:dihydroxyacid dehydratase/phosphogluconate dehydratase